jgi:hypothetical protein
MLNDERAPKRLLTARWTKKALIRWAPSAAASSQSNIGLSANSTDWTP